MSHVGDGTDVIIRNIRFVRFHILNFRNWNVMLWLGFVNRRLGGKKKKIIHRGHGEDAAKEDPNPPAHAYMVDLQSLRLPNEGLSLS